MPVLTEILEAQRNHLASGATLPLAARRAALGRLEYVLAERETLLLDALQADLGKSHFEGYETELGMVYAELHDAQKHLARWMRPKTVSTPLAHFPSKSRIYPEPYGTALILSPWNYPVQLCLAPLVGALAAGCCAVVKPSNYAPATSAALAEVLAEAFPPERVAVVTGGRAENQSLLEQKFDKIFFTGGVKVGRLVMESAARNLTPVTLELGGKSPCLLDHTANLELAAVRLAWGKTLNSGQTCVAPDYLLIEQSVRDRFLPLLRDAIVRLYGEAPLRNSQYGRIVNQKHFDRLRGLLEGETVYCGGRFDESARKIEPTVLIDVQPDAPVMQEEIFGPLLPVLTWRSLDEAIAFVNARPKPLALYLFTEDRRTEQTVRERVSFGGGCVNDTIVHLANPRLPFGGVGESGMGSYHGKRSFDEFTHYKSVLKKSTRLDIGLRYPPYNDTKYAWLRRFF